MNPWQIEFDVGAQGSVMTIDGSSWYYLFLVERGLAVGKNGVSLPFRHIAGVRGQWSMTTACFGIVTPPLSPRPFRLLGLRHKGDSGSGELKGGLIRRGFLSTGQRWRQQHFLATAPPLPPLAENNAECLSAIVGESLNQSLLWEHCSVS